MTRRGLVQSLLRSKEPSVRWRTRVRVLGESPTGPRIAKLEAEIRTSERARALLATRDLPYREGTNRSVYHYWQGLHWALAALADIGYPSGDTTVAPLVERCLRQWLRPNYSRSYVADGGSGRRREVGVPVVEGRARRCASQQGSALLYAARLGFLDERADRLAELLREWQWPDGGWNCDLDPSAHTSSFMETLLPMRGLAAYASATGRSAPRRASERASEVLLSRGLFRRRSDGTVMRRRFLELHYPLYWYYDVLGGLKGVAEVGRLADHRCSEALDWLEGRELAGGGWAADSRLFRVSRSFVHRGEYVGWGPPSSRRPNEWVTTDALYVLREAGRLEL